MLPLALCFSSEPRVYFTENNLAMKGNDTNKGQAIFGRNYMQQYLVIYEKARVCLCVCVCVSVTPVEYIRPGYIISYSG
jgi:hypothetical protein